MYLGLNFKHIMMPKMMKHDATDWIPWRPLESSDLIGSQRQAANFRMIWDELKINLEGTGVNWPIWPIWSWIFLKRGWNQVKPLITLEHCDWEISVIRETFRARTKTDAKTSSDIEDMGMGPKNGPKCLQVTWKTTYKRPDLPYHSTEMVTVKKQHTPNWWAYHWFIKLIIEYVSDWGSNNVDWQTSPIYRGTFKHVSKNHLKNQFGMSKSTKQFPIHITMSSTLQGWCRANELRHHWKSCEVIFDHYKSPLFTLVLNPLMPSFLLVKSHSGLESTNVLGKIPLNHQSYWSNHFEIPFTISIDQIPPKI